MEKLIELLNEYEKELNTGLHWRIDEEYGMLWRGISLTGVEQYLISKHYGFIKWLVENDKIMVIDKEIGTSEEDYICGTKYRLFKECYSDYEILLMLLSISNEPIDFLISILK